jgi:CheY-like chemotaxis protein
MSEFAATKIILIAHRDASVRDRFAAALADARHQYVTANSGADAVAAVNRASLAIIDVSLHEDPAAWVRQLRAASTMTLPVLVFAGTVRSATDSRSLWPVAVAGYINEHASTAQILPALAPHLFPANFDRRLSPRLVVSVPVSYRSGATIAGAFTLNVSRGGLAIRTLTPLEAGAAISVKFRLPPGTTDIERSGHVVWADRRVGMGIQFTEELDLD